jgi:predicted Zn-dependent peptidase
VGQEGLAWLTAQALRYGGTSAHPPEAFEGALSALDASVKVVVDKEVVGFVATAPASNTAQLAALLGEMFASPSFDEASVAAAKQRGVAWLEKGLGSASGRLVGDAMEKWVYQGHPYGHPVQGRSSVMPLLGAADIQNYYQGRYVRPAMAIGVSAGVSDAVVVGLQSDLSQRPVTLYRDVTPRPVAPKTADNDLRVAQAGSSPWLGLATRISVSPGHPDWPALILAQHIFAQAQDAEGFFSGGGFGAGRGDRLWGVSLPSVEVSSARRAVEAFVADGVTEASMNAAKDQMLQKIEASSGSEQLAWSVTGQLMGWPNPRVVLKEGLEGLTLDAIRAAIITHIEPKDFRAVVVDAVASDEVLDGASLFR